MLKITKGKSLLQAQKNPFQPSSYRLRDSTSTPYLLRILGSWFRARNGYSGFTQE